MIAIAHFIAISFYLGAAAFAAAPFARPVNAPIRTVAALLACGIAAHLAALLAFGVSAGAVPMTGRGPFLSSAGVVLAITLLTAEFSARAASLPLVAAPPPPTPPVCANIRGLPPGSPPADGARGVWLLSHIG